MYQTLLIRHLDAIALLMLNRPQQLNACTVQMGEELVHAFDALRADDSVRILVLTGAGRAFCAGLDMKAATQTSDPQLPALGEERLIRSFGAKLAFPFAKLGIVPGLGSSYLLPRLPGPGRPRCSR